MAMVLGGICGVLTLIGGAGLLWRRLTNQRVRATSTTPDIIIKEHFADPVSVS
jgi:nitrate reductase gamma subunit